jgi:hypothetical protein
MALQYAMEWADQQADTLLALGPEEPPPTWDSFMQSMNDVFNKPQDACSALEELQGLKQNKTSAMEYFTKFEGLMQCTGLNRTHHSDVLVTY